MAHSWIRFYAHLIWSTHERRAILAPSLHPRVSANVARQCTRLGAELLAIGGTDDHLHVLVALAPSRPLSELVRAMKGASAHEARAEGLRWQHGYGVVSVSPGALDTVTTYVRTQREHHARATLDHELELLPDDATDD